MNNMHTMAPNKDLQVFWKIGDTWPFRDSWQLDMPPLPQKKKNIIQMLTGKKSTSLVFDVSPWFATCHAASVLVHPSKQQHAAEKGPLCSWPTRSGRSRRHRAPVPLAVAHGTHLIFPVPRHVRKKIGCVDLPFPCLRRVCCPPGLENLWDAFPMSSVAMKLCPASSKITCCLKRNSSKGLNARGSMQGRRVDNLWLTSDSLPYRVGRTPTNRLLICVWH